MAYGVMPYLIAKETLDKIYGSKKKEYINEVIEEKSEIIEELEDLFDEDPVDYIKDLVYGSIKHEDGGLYGYSLEMIFDVYGEMLDNDYWYPTDCWYTLDEALINDLPYDLPEPDDFPIYRVIMPENMEPIIEEINNLDEIPNEAKKQVIDWLKLGIKTNKILGLFYY